MRGLVSGLRTNLEDGLYLGNPSETKPGRNAVAMGVVMSDQAESGKSAFSESGFRSVSPEPSVCRSSYSGITIEATSILKRRKIAHELTMVSGYRTQHHLLDYAATACFCGLEVSILQVLAVPLIYRS